MFLPVLFLEDVEGQIFADLALTISIAVAFSIIVAITVVPAAAGRWLGGHAKNSGYGEGWPRLTDRIIEWTRTRRQQVGWVIALLIAPLAAAWLWLPKLDYLPPVKRAAIDAFFSFPPGMSPEAVDREIVGKLLDRMGPYMRGEQQPALKNWYILLWPGGGALGARVIDEENIGELERIVREEVVVGIPDTRVFVNEGELFGGIGGSARSVAIHLQTTDIAALNVAAEAGRVMLEQSFPGANVQSFPNADVKALSIRRRHCRSRTCSRRSTATSCRRCAPGCRPMRTSGLPAAPIVSTRSSRRWARISCSRDAIAVRQDGSYLMRVRTDGTAERVVVASTASEGNLVTIRGPVNAGDMVVVRGAERLQQGQRVTIVTRDAQLSKSDTVRETS